MEFELVQILLMLVVIFVTAKLASAIFAKFGIPGLVGEIIVGILLASIVINGQSIAEMLQLFVMVDGKRETTEMFHILKVFAELGVVFLLFSVGLETRVKDLMSVGKAALLVAVLGVVIPFILGYAYVEYFQDGNMYHALFLGAAMVATSVGITARVIKDMKLTDTRESRIIIGAAVIDDVLGMIVLAIVSGMAKSGSGSINIVDIAVVAIMALVFVVLVMLFALKAVPKIHEYMELRTQKKFAEDNNYIPPKYNMLVISIAVCIGFAWLAEFIGLAAIIGSFLAGMIFADYAFEWGLEPKIEAINTFLVSFFFVYVGLQVDISSINGALIMTTAIVIVLAIIGKYVGCSLGAKLGDKTLDKGSLNIIGVGMIPRGEVGIIAATIGLGITLVGGGTAISQDLYTVVVLMSVITTIIAPPILSVAFRKKYPPEYTIQQSDRL